MGEVGTAVSIGDARSQRYLRSWSRTIPDDKPAAAQSGDVYNYGEPFLRDGDLFITFMWYHDVVYPDPETDERRFIVAYEMPSGREVWRWDLPTTTDQWGVTYYDAAAVTSMDGLNDGIMYFTLEYYGQGWDDSILLYKMNAQTGQVIWGPKTLVTTTTSNPSAGGGSVAITNTGDLLVGWTIYDTTIADPRVHGWYSRMSSDGDVLVAGTDKGGYFASFTWEPDRKVFFDTYRSNATGYRYYKVDPVAAAPLNYSAYGTSGFLHPSANKMLQYTADSVRMIDWNTGAVSWTVTEAELGGIIDWQFGTKHFDYPYFAISVERSPDWWRKNIAVVDIWSGAWHWHEKDWYGGAQDPTYPTSYSYADWQMGEFYPDGIVTVQNMWGLIWDGVRNSMTSSADYWDEPQSVLSFRVPS